MEKSFIKTLKFAWLRITETIALAVWELVELPAKGKGLPEIPKHGMLGGKTAG